MPIREKSLKAPLLKRLSRQMRGLHRERVLATHGIAVIAETKNGLLAVQPGDFGVSRALLQCGEYDWQQVELLGRRIHAGSRLVFFPKRHPGKIGAPKTIPDGKPQLPIDGQ